MKRYAIGETVGFQSNTGRRTEGQIIQILVEKQQPNILLIERPDDRWRAFRLETEVSPPSANEPDKPLTRRPPSVGKPRSSGWRRCAAFVTATSGTPTGGEPPDSDQIPLPHPVEGVSNILA